MSCHFPVQPHLSGKAPTCGLCRFTNSARCLSTCGLMNQAHWILLLQLKAGACLPGMHRVSAMTWCASQWLESYFHEAGVASYSQKYT